MVGSLALSGPACSANQRARGVTANYHWPLGSSPFLTYLGLPDIPGLVFLRGAEDLIDKVSN
jgi:hypothetical protein